MIGKGSYTCCHGSVLLMTVCVCCRNAATGSVFGSSDVNHEAWRPVKYLRGHDSDVQDLAWSADNKYLASCGVDGFVIVWSGTTFGKDQRRGIVQFARN